MIKLIASDLDGTLLKDGAQKLNPEIFDLILELKKQGIHFIAASGRQYASIRRLFEPIKDEISYITENGSLCIHNGEVISRGTIERGLGLRILDEIHNRENCEILLSCEGKCYIDSPDDSFYHMLHNEMGFDITRVPNTSDITETFLKIAVCDSKTTSDSAKYFKDKFSSEIKVVTAGNIWIDFIAPNANKGTALQFFLNHFSIKPEECMAFGDQHNDVEMLSLAGHSYAMSTAAPGVAPHAKYTTDSVEDVLKNLVSKS